MGGDDYGPTLAERTWRQGAIAGCHCSVLWWGETIAGQLWQIGCGARVPSVLWGETMVGRLCGSANGSRMPLLGAIAGCRVLWWGEDDGGPTLADWTWCQNAIVLCYGGGGDGGPTLGERTWHQPPTWRHSAIVAPCQGGIAIPQVALAIGALTSNRRGDGCTRWRIGRGAISWVPLLGCHCLLGAIAAVPLGRVPLLGCMAACHCGMRLLGAPW